MPSRSERAVFTDSKHLVVAIDAGGTSTRAVALSLDGTCRGYGSGPSGNPTSAGPEAAAAALVGAVRAALAAAGAAETPPVSVLAAMAGAGVRGSAWLSAAFAASGMPVPAEVEADLTAIYLSATLAPVGTALILGTGAIAARVRDARIERVADGLGWLLGDEGSGFWIGHRAVRRVAEELDGRAGPTAMTPLVLRLLAVSDVPEQPGAVPRPGVLAALLHAVYAARPVELAALAPAAFDAADAGDPEAAEIVAEAAARAAAALATVGAGDGPVVLGGGVLAARPGFASAVRAALGPAVADGQVLSVRDGVVGAAVLALTRAGVRVDESVRERIARTLEEVRLRAAGGDAAVAVAGDGHAGRDDGSDHEDGGDKENRKGHTSI